MNEEKNQQAADNNLINYDQVEIKMPEEDIFGREPESPKPKVKKSGGLFSWLNILLVIILLLILAAWGLYSIGFNFSDPMGWLNEQMGSPQTEETGLGNVEEELPPAATTTEENLNPVDEPSGEGNLSANASTTPIELETSTSTTSTSTATST